jgi:hypothetical protein
VGEAGLGTLHRIVFGESRSMKELREASDYLAATSSAYSPIEILDKQFESLG